MGKHPGNQHQKGFKKTWESIEYRSSDRDSSRQRWLGVCSSASAPCLSLGRPPAAPSPEWGRFGRLKTSNRLFCVPMSPSPRRWTITLARNLESAAGAASFRMRVRIVLGDCVSLTVPVYNE